MKRELLCDTCGKRIREMWGNNEPHTGEFVKMYRGKIKPNRGYVCDSCGKVVTAGCGVALSIYTTTRPYHSWEYEHLIDIAEYTRSDLLAGAL